MVPPISGKELSRGNYILQI